MIAGLEEGVEAWLAGVEQGLQTLGPHHLQTCGGLARNVCRVAPMTYSRGTMTRWLRAGKCAGPALTAFLQAQAAKQQPAALQACSGFLVSNPAQLPQVVAQF